MPLAEFFSERVIRNRKFTAGARSAKVIGLPTSISARKLGRFPVLGVDLQSAHSIEAHFGLEWGGRLQTGAGEV
jgi:hypothetical protein